MSETVPCTYTHVTDNGVTKYTCTECGYNYSETASLDYDVMFGWYFEEGEDDSEWQFIDDDGDGSSWGILNNSQYSYEGDRCLMSSSYSGAQENWAVTPAIDLTGVTGAILSMYLRNNGPYSGSYDLFAVRIGTSDDPDQMTQVIPLTDPGTDYTNYTVDLSAYSGQTIYVAFYHYAARDIYYMFLDNVELLAPQADPCGDKHNAVAVAEVPPTCTTDGVAAHYECSVCHRYFLDELAQQPVIPADLVIDALGHTWTYSSYNNGTHHQHCTVCDFDEDADCVYTHEAFHGMTKNTCACGYVCYAKSWFFEEDPTDWNFVDSDGDGYTWSWCPYGYGAWDAYEGDGLIASASYINNYGALTPDNWAITPAVNLEAAGSAKVSFWAWGQDKTYFSEVFKVYVSTAYDPTNFDETCFDELSADITANHEFTRYEFDLSAYVGMPEVYIAIRHYNVTDMYWLNVDNFEIVTDPTYLVRYDANGGTGIMADDIFDLGAEGRLTANSFTLDDYAFAGWNTEPDGSGTAYADEQNLSALNAEFGAPITLYAIWVPETAPVATTSTVELRPRANGDEKFDMRFVFNVQFNKSTVNTEGADHGYTGSDAEYVLASLQAKAGIVGGGTTNWIDLNNFWSVNDGTNATGVFTVVIVGIPETNQNRVYTVQVRYAYLPVGSTATLTDANYVMLPMMSSSVDAIPNT